MERKNLDDPEQKSKVVSLLVKLTPFTFVLCYLLAWLQGAELKYSLLIAGVGAAMCGGAAAAIHFLGSKSWLALVALKIAIMMMGKR